MRLQCQLDLGLVQPHSGHDTNESSVHGREQGTLSEQGGGSDGFDTANKIDITEESKLYPFFQEMWRKVDVKTGYPDDFVKRRITGSVTVQLTVNRQGAFTGRFLRVDSDEVLLKTYVLAILAHALVSPIPENLWMDRAEVTVVTRFDFRVFGIGESPDSRKEDHFKNILSFKRSAYVDPRLNEYVEKYFTRYIPPIIPIPGGFYIDFIQAYKMIEAIGKPDPDELRKQRIEMMKEEWQRVVQKSEKSE